MKIKLLTALHFEFSEIDSLYGDVLSNFNLFEENDFAFIVLSDLTDIKKLDNMLEEYISNYDGDNSDINWYNGLLFYTNDNEFVIEIQDNFS